MSSSSSSSNMWVVVICVVAVSTVGCTTVTSMEESRDMGRTAASHHRILMVAANGMPSHAIAFMDIASALADHGHQITVAVYRKYGRPNMREIVLPVETLQVPNAFQGGRMATSSLIDYWIPSCFKALASQEIRDLKKEEFDLIIVLGVLSECFASLVYEMQLPFVMTSPIPLTGSTAFWMAGNPMFWSMSTSMFTGAVPGDKGLTFMDRLALMASELMTSSFIQYMFWKMDSECRKQGLCAPDMPSIQEILVNNSLFIINGIRTMDFVGLPIVPGLIYAGGIHLKTPKSLPKDLEEWASDSGEAGFIYFSMGSVIKPSDMPNEYKEALVEAFAALPQRVLWKWNEESIANLSSNVRLAKWLPQQDILGHPNLRLFIGHGGYHSTLEAIYNGVPVFGLPLFSDQYINMGDIVSRGAGVTMDWSNFTAASLLEKITGILNNPSIKQNALQQSAILRDQLVSPQENVNYWINYVIKHRGATHLKCPKVYMSLYELYNMDVWLVLLLIAILLLYVQYKSARHCWKYCQLARRNNKKKE